jgi:nitric oxide reductase subunit B
MHATRKLWTWLAVICALSFGVLLWVGSEIYLSAPPIPQQVVSKDGKVLYTREQIQQGQEAWLAAGGQQLGTVWGHGSYLAPDWSADWLHREALALLDVRAQQQYQLPFAQLDTAKQAALQAVLKQEMRANTYDAASETLQFRLNVLKPWHRWQPITAACSAAMTSWINCASNMRCKKARYRMPVTCRH